MRLTRTFFIALALLTLVPTVAFAAPTTETALSENVLLAQIDKAQHSVVDAVPTPIKDAVEKMYRSIDAWRIKQGEKFATVRSTSEHSIAKNEKASTTGTDTDASGAYVNQPVSNIQLILFSILAFIFLSPLIFYIGGTLLIYILLRVLLRRVRFGRKRRTPRQTLSSKE